MMTDDQYLAFADACALRLEADKTGDPALYAQAAELFELADMPNAAARMREKAEYYREVEAIHEQIS